jgi:large subunit ribosomal protein L1
MSTELKKVIEELRKEKKRNFNQTIDLIVNLKGVDVRKTNVSFVAEIPYKIKEKKVCGFLNEKNSLIDTITKQEFPKYKDAKKLRELVKNYDFFIASASLMPAVATTFGKGLGPSGKMPSPQLGIITKEEDDIIKNVLETISKSIKIRVKEASIKIAVGKDSMKDEDIAENVDALYKKIVSNLPNKKENVKNVLIKFTMGKPVEVKL